MAQNNTITGKVVGPDDGLPLPGVSVHVKGGCLALLNPDILHLRGIAILIQMPVHRKITITLLFVESKF